MNLQTQLTIYGRNSFDFEYSKQGLKHDAMVAHALVFAMASLNEFGEMDEAFAKAAKLLEECGVCE